MAQWKKPNGIEIETVDLEETILYCKSIGWKRIDKKIKGDPEVKPLVKPTKTTKVKSKARISNPTANPKPMDNG